MLNTFFVAFRLKNSYRKNSALYSLKAIPGVKKLLPESLYGNHALTIFANIISGIQEFCSIFLWKLIYFALVYLAASKLPTGSAVTFSHLMVFLTLIGGLFNTRMFEPTRDKYYAIILMRMDAKLYALTDYLYFLIKVLVGSLPFCLLFGYLSGVSIFVSMLIPVYIVELKLCFAAYALINYKRKNRLKNENSPEWTVWAALVVLLAATFAPPFFGYAVSPMILCWTASALLFPSLLALWYILHFNQYRTIYKGLLQPKTFSTPKTTRTGEQIAMQKKISIDSTQTSNKNGYAYLNELFMKRHSKLLTRSAKRITVSSVILVALAVISCLIFPDARREINELPLTFLPYFLFVMYMINRGKAITQAMFLNCDHSMLTYRFYRQPKTIVVLFTERLKSIVLINLMPAIVIALGLPLLLYITGGTDQPLNYVLLFVSILAMSVFFSVHNIVLYYLLQPYNVNLESKSATYSIVNWLTYIVCYVAIGKRAPTLIFGASITVFCLIYVAVAILLAYRLAPKTFHLRT